MHRLSLLVLVLPLTAAAAPAPKDKPAGPGDNLAGEWVRERATVAGAEEKDDEPLRYVFAPDGKWVVYRADRKLPGEGRAYTVDPALVPPVIDLFPDGTGAATPRPVSGIYKVAGDTLTLCLPVRGGGRPTAFESTAEDQATLMVFKRVRVGK